MRTIVSASRFKAHFYNPNRNAKDKKITASKGKCFLFFILAIFAGGFSAVAQTTDEPVFVELVIPTLSENLGRADMARKFQVKGSAYLEESFKEGTIINGTGQNKVQMRYNVYDDRFQFLDEHGKKKMVMKSASIKVSLDGKTYEMFEYNENPKENLNYYIPEPLVKKNAATPHLGYFQVLHHGATKLLLRVSKKVSKMGVPKNGYELIEPSEFRLLTNYFVKRPNRPAENIQLTKKQVLTVLNDKYSQLNTYIKKNKLKVNTVEDMVQLLGYYDSLR